MQLSNYHSHCTFCDGRSIPEDFVRFAITHGFRAYGFSSHSPLPFETFWNMSKDDMPEYLQEIKRLKQKYSDQLEIYAGLEIDYLDETYNASIPYFQELPLDYRIGSIHFLPVSERRREHGLYRRLIQGIRPLRGAAFRGRCPVACQAFLRYHDENDRGRRHRYRRAYGQDLYERTEIRDLQF